MIDTETNQILLGYRMFEKGFLPYAGGWKSQSNKFLEAMMFIDNKILEEKAKNAGK